MVKLRSEREEHILSEIIKSHFDWSLQIAEGADIIDLDTDAILVARENFKIKNPRVANEVDRWNDINFLNRARLCINGKVTRTAIILLGKPEAEHFLNPGIARITWILKDKDNIERDYQHFFCPMILAVDEVFGKIRNLKYRYLKEDSLFPDEVEQFEPFTIKEALSNCIAHQDYPMGGKINIVEREDGILVFSNLGSFLPGNVENVINSDTPPEFYRNNHLVQVMFNLNMIDSVGSGIKRMFRFQRERFFPMPDYDFSNNRVQATITGKILDMEYAKVLARNTGLTLMEIIMLDKVQKKKTLIDAEINHLRSKGLIEGKKPRIYISAKLAQTIGQKAVYTRNKPFDKQYYLDFIVKGIKEHGSLDRSDIDQLLIDKLSDLYNYKQRKTKITNLIAELRAKGIIKNVGTDYQPKWILV